jgi:DNA-directed RNA polymerase subunit RPC12/RpoP
MGLSSKIGITRRNILCGLVGVAGNLSFNDEHLMKRLLILDYFRGTDSTGLASISAKGVPSIVKMATHPINLFDSKAFDKALNGYGSSAFIGHNRAATLGAVSDLNAHPFQYGDIIGAHNGTLDKATWQRLEQAAGVQTDVDSAAIFACINEIGIDDTVKLMEHGRTSSTGAWALVWYDMKDDNIRFLRNEHRPLWYAMNDKGDKLVWASEYEMIQAAAGMTNGWEVESDKEGFSYFPFRPDWLYEINLSQLIGTMSLKDIAGCANRRLRGKEPIVVAQTPTGGGAPFHTAHGGPYHPKTTPVTMGTPTTTTTKEQTGSNISSGKGCSTVVTLFPDDTQPDDPFGGAISLHKFKEIAAYGCSYCGADVNEDDPGLTIFTEDDVILCKSCSKHATDDVKIYASSSAMQHLLTMN